MTKTDTAFFLGLALIVIGFGGGYELSVWNYGQAFLRMAAAEGAADPATLARDIGHSAHFLVALAPVGLLGVVLVLLAFRGYLLGRLTPAPAPPAHGA